MIKLLSTDFDGTLVNHTHPPRVVPALFTMLTDLRKEGVLWAINTGRALEHILEGLQEFSFPLIPDYILTNEREVFHMGPEGQWQNYGDWNGRCARAHDELFEQAQSILDEIALFLQRETTAQAIFEESRMVGIATNTDEEMDQVIEFIDLNRGHLPLFNYQRNTIYLRFCHAEYSKGAALGELGRLTGINRDEIFAAGDHHNDISMLDGTFARWVACPNNSIDLVKKTVRSADGYIARGVCSEGIVEALNYFTKKISADSLSESASLSS